MSRRSLGTAAAVIGLFAAAAPAHAGGMPGEPTAYDDERAVTAAALQEATQMENRRFAPGTGGSA